MEAKVIEKFTPSLVTAICDCVQSVADACLGKGLISDDTNRNILQSVETSQNKTRILLKAVKSCTEIDSVSFDIFLRVLNEKLPERCRSKLLPSMSAELADQQTTTNECTALIPTCNVDSEVTSVECQFSMTSDVSRLLIQEQNIYVGKLEETIRQHDRTCTEMKLLREKVEANEKMRAQLSKIGQTLQLAPANVSHQGETATTTMSSTSEAEIVLLREKIKELESKSDELAREMRLYRTAIDIKVEEVMNKLMNAQKQRELVYEQKFREFRGPLINTEREPPVLHLNEPGYESEEESDSEDKPASKRAKIESIKTNGKLVIVKT